MNGVLHCKRCRKRRWSLLALSVLLAGVPVAPGMAREIYVAPQGSDSRDGSTWADALRSPQKAVDQALPGDTVIIRRGLTPYPGLVLRRSGAPGRPITIRGESAEEPPVFSGARQERGWQVVAGRPGIVTVATSARPLLLVEDDQALAPASSSDLTDGAWFHDGRLLWYRPTAGSPKHHVVWRPSRGGGILVEGQSHLVIQDLECRIGQGACVDIRGGGDNVVRRVTARWYWRGVNLAAGTTGNLVEDCLVQWNREGIYIHGGSSRNVIRRCQALDNGNAPVWSRGDRAGIAIGEKGSNEANVVEDCRIARNGGPNSDPGLIAYRAPGSVLRRNEVLENFGSGIFVTISSHDSVVEDNLVARNGFGAAKAGIRNVAALSVRRSRGVLVQGNRVLDNQVTANSPWRPSVEQGPRGGLELRGLRGDDMRGIRVLDNQVRGTRGGPDYHVTPGPDFRGLEFRPVPPGLVIPAGN